MSMLCQLRMCNRFSSILHFGGLFPCFCDFSRYSLVSMLQDQGPGIKPPLMVEDLIFRGGNSNIPNQDAKTNISSYVSCFYPQCLAKMKNKPFLRQCFLTISWIPGGGGGLLSKVLYGEAPPRGPNSYPLKSHFWEKIAYTFRRKFYPFHIPTERVLLNFSLRKPLKYLDDLAFRCVCSRYFESPFYYLNAEVHKKSVSGIGVCAISFACAAIFRTRSQVENAAAVNQSSRCADPARVFRIGAWQKLHFTSFCFVSEM